MKVVNSIKFFFNGLLFSLGVLCGSMLYAITLDLVSFNKGDLIKSADFNTNFTNIKNSITELETKLNENTQTLNSRILNAELPAGTIIGWDRDFAYPAQLVLKEGSYYVPCDGRSISDSTSIYFGRNIPLLNDATNGSFLVGGSESSLVNNFAIGSGLSQLNTFSVIWLCKIK